MKQMRVRKYKLVSDKIKGDPIRILFLSDMHGCFAGDHLDFLLRVIVSRRPDLILVGGDMGIARYDETWDCVRELIRRLVEIAPVYYALGNHEQCVRIGWNPRHVIWKENAVSLLEELASQGILLDNRNAAITVKDTPMVIHGLSFNYSCYRKPFPAKLCVDRLTNLLGETPNSSSYDILLAHNPYYGDVYFDWGSDLILSGHYHGGLLRLGRNHGLASPYLRPLPNYCCGGFARGQQAMLVSAGMGEHTIPLRICNPREMLEIQVSAASAGSSIERG